MAPFTIMDIKLLCGVTAFKRGEDYNQSGRVTNLVISEDQLHYEAQVRGSERYQVTVDIDGTGEVVAGCSCPGDGRHYDYCKHVAAVLLAIHEWGRGSRSIMPQLSLGSLLNLLQAKGPIPVLDFGSKSRVGTLVEERKWERPQSDSQREQLNDAPESPPVHFAQAGRPSSASGWGRSADKPSYRTADQILSMFAKDRRSLHGNDRKCSLSTDPP